MFQMTFLSCVEVISQRKQILKILKRAIKNTSDPIKHFKDSQYVIKSKTGFDLRGKSFRLQYQKSVIS